MAQSGMDPDADRSTTPEEKEREKFHEDFTGLMNDPAFRRVLWYVIERLCNTHSSVLDAHNVYETFRAGGRQEVGILLRSLAQSLNTKQYLAMLKEAVDLRMQRASLSPPPKPQP